jgi:hypothetical protein
VDPKDEADAFTINGQFYGTSNQANIRDNDAIDAIAIGSTLMPPGDLSFTKQPPQRSKACCG